ncbi:MAG: carboxypeptidase-like regulatory domain-containing protein [Propionibacteriaceae bacterium]|nr:carboxypeptidase-like regulatory domain-containing protein [Propionibacteriaceae bacterium]
MFSAVVCLFAAWAFLTPAAAAPLPRAPEGTQLTASIGARQDDGGYPVTGQLLSYGQPVGEVRIDITVTSGGGATATTASATGEFTATVRPSPGATTIIVRWAGNSAYAAAERRLSVTAPAPPAELTVQADPASVSPGSLVSVSGVLTANGQPIGDALITAAASWDSETQSALTQADGAYAIWLAVPDASDTVSSFTVTVAYSGEGYYTAVSRDCQITVAQTTPEPTPEASAGATATATPSASSQTTTAAAPGGSSLRFGSPLFTVVLIVFIVAALGACTLLIVAVVSRRRRVLAADERRGFGSDFGLSDGQAEADPAEGPLDDWFGPAPEDR